MKRRILVITVTGEMDERLREEFEDAEISIDHGVTRLRVVSVDAAVLHGVLNRIAAFSSELLDVYEVDEGSPHRR